MSDAAPKKKTTTTKKRPDKPTESKSKLILPGDKEAESSVALDGETQDAGDVIVMPEPEAANFDIVAVRIAEWTEWLPQFPDQATEGAVGVANGSTALQTLKGEKLAEIKANAVPGQTVKKKVKMGDEEVDITFQLYMYQATLVQIAGDDTMPEPLITHRPETPSNIVRASALPPAMAGGPNRKARRGR
jgi:hypothetical protein